MSSRRTTSSEAPHRYFQDLVQPKLALFYDNYFFSSLCISGYPYETSTLMVTRDCAQQCSNSDSEDLGSERELYCCEGNLCNNRYGVVSKASSHRGASTYHLQSGAYGGLIMVFSLFIVLFPSWVWWQFLLSLECHLMDYISSTDELFYSIIQVKLQIIFVSYVA